MSGFGELTDAWQRLQRNCQATLRRDIDASEAEIRRRQATAADQANRAKNQVKLTALALVGLPGPVPAIALVASQLAASRAQARVADLQQRADQLRAEAGDEHASVQQLLTSIDGQVTGRYASGRDTSQRFGRISQNWAEVSASVAALQADMASHGTQAAWQAASSQQYESMVIPQLDALHEFSKVAANSSTVAVGVATLQEAIYQATVASFRAADATIADAAGRVVAMAGNGMFYHGTLTIRETLTQLLGWMRTSELTWAIPSFQLTADIALTMGTVSTLQDGWPERLADSQPTATEGSDVIEVQRRSYSFGRAEGRVGGSLGL